MPPDRLCRSHSLLDPTRLSLRHRRQRRRGRGRRQRRRHGCGRRQRRRDAYIGGATLALASAGASTTAAAAVGVGSGGASPQQSPTSAARLCLLRPPGSGYCLILADGSPHTLKKIKHACNPISAHSYISIAILLQGGAHDFKCIYLVYTWWNLKSCARILLGIYQVYTRHKSDEIVKL